jgi:creatinine amidohydrolase
MGSAGNMKDSAQYSFAEMPWCDADALLGSGPPPVLLLPVGSVEAHGPHLPLATDTLISLGMCERLAARHGQDYTIRVLPPIAYGVTRYAGRFTGTIHVSEATLKAMIVDVCESLIAQGFIYVVLVNNHFEPEHLQTLHSAADAIEESKGVTIGLLDLTRRYRAQRLTAEFRELGSHAGQYETSLMLKDRPDLVDEDARVRLAPNPVNLAAMTGGMGVADFGRMGLEQAYNGTPADATAAEGEESFDTLATMLAELIGELVRGEGGRDRPGRYGHPQPGGGAEAVSS